MPDSYPFPTYSGLLEPKHYKRIGSAIWLFLWCISSTTKEVERNGVVWGIVLGNKPLKLKELAETFGVNEKTVRRWLETLEENNYIRITRVAYGLIITVKNSKKFQNRVDKNVHSNERERTKTSNLERTDMSTLSDKNVHSNKDITVDITNNIYAATTKNAHEEGSAGVPLTVPSGESSISDDEIAHASKCDEVDIIAEKFIQLRNNGVFLNPDDYLAIKEILEAGVTLENALKWMEEKFANYKPKHNRDRINRFSYCVPYILDRQSELNARKEAKERHVRPKLRVVGQSESSTSEEAKRLENIAKRKGLIRTVRDIDCDF